jgi:ABC-type multidrug transport system fused ATPase/permease subunit
MEFPGLRPGGARCDTLWRAKQRVAIARRCFEAGILIFDDATSSVDAETEQSIWEALERLMKGRTTFIIAHRIQTLRRADLIVVLKQGRVVQSGTHAELVGRHHRTVYELGRASRSS